MSMPEPQSGPVADAFAEMPPVARDLRALVRDVAAELGIALEETLKWGEPAYLPGHEGTTVRIGPDRDRNGAKLLVNCRTSLVEHWRERFGGRLGFEGNRAILVPGSGALDRSALRVCIADALAYHARKGQGHG